MEKSDSIQTKKTHRMLSIEKQYEQPIGQVLQESIIALGIKQAAQRLGISRSTLYLWIAKLGLEVNHNSTVISRQGT